MGLLLRRIGDGRARAIAQNDLLRKKQGLRSSRFDTMTYDSIPAICKLASAMAAPHRGFLYSTRALATR